MTTQATTEFEAVQAKLCEVDCVLEKGTETLLKKFMGMGGKPQQLIQFLSENYRGYPQMINLLQEWLILTGMQQKDIHDELVKYTKQIIKSSFDPEKADLIFTQAKAPPLWLEDMVKDKDWRILIYELSETHKKCLMLSYAIQRIAEAGHYEEIGCLTTASTFFSVFIGVFEPSIQNIFSVDERELLNILPMFLKLCCLSANTYLYSQSILAKLLSIPEFYGRAKRLIQELDNHFAINISPTQKLGLKIQLYLAPPPPSLASSIESIIGSRSTNPGDILRLYDLYSNSSPPPVEFVRNPLLLDLLVRDLFTSSSNMQQIYLKKYAFILAYATVVSDKEEKKEEDQTKLKETHLAIETISSLCKQSKPRLGKEFRLLGKEFDKYLCIPVISIGVLRYIRSSFEERSYYTSTSFPSSKLIFYYLLRRICLLHPLHQSSVFEFYVSIFQANLEIDAATTMDVKKAIMNNIIYLFSLGYVEPVLEKVLHWCTSADQSLVRLFILKVIEVVEPPFSLTFATGFFNIISSASPNLGKNPKIGQFLETCKQQGFTWDNLDSLIQKFPANQM